MTVSLSLRATKTRAVFVSGEKQPENCSPKEHTVSRARLALAVVAVVVASEGGSIYVDRVGDGLAETVSGERHVGGWLLKLDLVKGVF